MISLKFCKKDFKKKIIFNVFFDAYFSFFIILEPVLNVTDLAGQPLDGIFSANDFTFKTIQFFRHRLDGHLNGHFKV